MVDQIIIGFVWTLVTIGVGVAFIVALMESVPYIFRHLDGLPRFVCDTGILLLSVLWLFVGIGVIVLAWASLFVWRGEFYDFGTALYFAVVSVTTVGYGDVIVSEKARLLAGFAAADGFLIFGLYTAALYEVISRLKSDGSNKRA